VAVVAAAVELFEVVGAAEVAVEPAGSVVAAEVVAEGTAAVVAAVAFPGLAFPLEAGHQEAVGTLQTFRQFGKDSVQSFFAAADGGNSMAGHPLVGAAAAVGMAPEAAHMDVRFARCRLA
jgi:hypothetical protein